VKRRPCERCSTDLPVRTRQGARFCSTRCRVAAHRAGLPHDLRSRPRWVTHSKAKVPLTPRGRPASSTDRETWSRYEDVKDLPRRGFVLNGDGIVCLDLDHCLIDGRVTGRAAEILARCPSTYVEVSLSGTGLHVWGRASVPAGRRLDGVEVYGTGRYIAVTGERFGRCPSTLADLSDVVAWLLA
jgi:primase-polymerase (primpol)-like protein